MVELEAVGIVIPSKQKTNPEWTKTSILSISWNEEIFYTLFEITQVLDELFYWDVFVVSKKVLLSFQSGIVD